MFQGEVTFWRKKFELTCPGPGIFYNKDGKISNESQTISLDYDNDKKGLYYCQYKIEESSNVEYYFYVQGKGE